ncbi:hypothetical protein OAN307_c30290 [Octadecabacter antarcticus 307]|uniref:Uncharacterized protein n=1 Tax=Octadecabacter antarcticus 307 TaxID=391626 RepID=M9R9T7_9RHOB|nr:hypothetical protein [Octadecabacter antarcticus]AGI68573.1 hypothetical protein OAN307_c30290 [Octadecabacter antarcticus 307]
MQLRTLIHIPIVHSAEDMGSASDVLRQTYIRQKGLEAWEKSRFLIKQFWADIDAAVLALDVNFSQMRIYQDGLPVCGFEAKIVRDLAESQTSGKNYQIVAKLMDLGARLEGTEDLELLLKERELITSGNASPESCTNLASALVKSNLLDKRDYFIASRIDTTLQSEEVGILFLGALHDATAKLPATIKVVSLEKFSQGEISRGGREHSGQ